MEPLHLLVHSSNPETAARIERALRAGAPDCRIEVSTDAPALTAALRQTTAVGLVAETANEGGMSPSPEISAELRHDLNNHLALIRMLADLLADSHSAPPSFTAKAREIALAADAAAQTLRRTKQPQG